MSDIAKQIQGILEARRKQISPIETRIAQWTEFGKAIQGLADALSPSGQGAFDDKAAAVRSQLLDLRAERVVAERTKAWSVAKARFSRPTINIGVGGQMKVGKSTLLQSISGLGADAIPADNYECTANRSRIYHDPAASYAMILYHTWESFSKAVLYPIYSELKQPAPATLDLFGQQKISALGAEGQADDDHRKKLEEIHSSLWSYRDLLSGKTEQVSLDSIRELVALPSQEILKGSNPPRKYLAVRACDIRTKFYELDAANLGLVDLPGIGSLNKEVDAQNIEGISNDIDITLMIKRAAEQGGIQPVNAADRNALDLFKSVAKNDLGIDTPEDFVAFVVNGSSPEHMENCQNELRRRLGLDKFTIFKVDAREKTMVRTQLLEPTLKHLTAKLPTMDGKLLELLQKKDKEALEKMGRDLSGILGQVVSTAIPSSLEGEVNRWAEGVCGKLAKQINKIEAEYRDGSGETPSQERFKKHVGGFSSKLKKEWMRSHFDEKWLVSTSEEIAKDRNNTQAVKLRAMGVCRTELRKQYKEIDDAFQCELEEMWKKIATALRSVSGSLLPAGVDGHQGIAQFRSACVAAQCPALAEACDVILAQNFSLKIHFMPAVAKGMVELEPKEDKNGTPSAEGLGDDSNVIARKIKSHLEVRCENAIQKTAEEILAQVKLVDIVLYSLVNHANDLFIRSKDVEDEYTKLVRSHIDKMWGDEMQKLRENDDLCRQRSAAVSAYNKALEALTAA